MRQKTHAFPALPSASAYGLEQNFNLCEYTVPSDSRFHFSLLLPKEWEPFRTFEQLPKKACMQTPLALFRRKESNAGMAMNVFVMHVEHEIDPKDWLEMYLRSGDLPIVAIRETPGNSISKVEILTQSQTDQGMFISWWMVVKNGPRLFLLESHLLEECYEELAQRLAVTYASFQLLSPEARSHGEALRLFSHAEPSDFALYYPVSWKVMEQNQKSGIYSFCLIHQIQDDVYGCILVDVVSRTHFTYVQDATRAQLEKWTSQGIKLDGSSLKPHKLLKQMVRGWETSGQLTYEQKRMEFQMVIGEHKNAWFFFTLLGPKQTDAPYEWMVNRRAFSIVQTSLRHAEA